MSTNEKGPYAPGELHAVRVFVSYSHDSQAHADEVLKLVQRLRSDGVDAVLDRFVEGQPEEQWPRWMEQQIRKADFVLAICTSTWHRRFTGEEQPGRGLGATWEGHLLLNLLYADGGRNKWFIPVLLPGANERDVPTALRGASVYRLPDSYEQLLAHLLRRSAVAAVTLGPERPQEEHAAGKPLVELHRLPVPQVDRVLGRQSWIDALVGAVDDEGVSVASIIGSGGMGKSALTKTVVDRLAPDYHGARRVFGWSFYSQGTHQTYTTSTAFLEAALRFFGWNRPWPVGDEQRALALSELLSRQRSLLILDGVEPLQFAPQVRGGMLRDAGLRTLLLHIAREGLKEGGLVLLSSRQPIVEIGGAARHRLFELDNLAPEDGAALLRHLGVRSGQSTRVDHVDAALVDAARAAGGHPLTLVLLGRLLVTHFGGDALKWSAVLPEILTSAGGQTERILQYYEGLWPPDAPVRSVLAMLALFDRPAEHEEIELLAEQARLAQHLCGKTRASLTGALSVLREAALVSTDPLGRLDAHPLIRSYFALRLNQQAPDDMRDGHRILFEHLRQASTPPEPSLADLEPIIRAVYHGCLAGEYKIALDELFYKRLLMGDDERFYLRDELGAIATNLFVASCFFEGDFERPVSALNESDSAWVVSEASITLQTLGRPSEAARLIRTNVERFEGLDEYDNVAVSLENLVDCLMVLGRLKEAEETAREGVRLGGRSGYFFHDVTARSKLAIACCRRGAIEEGLAYFEAARAELEAKDKDRKPLLTSLNGYHHLSVLLDLGREVNVEHWTGLALRVARTLLDEALALLNRGRWLARRIDFDEGIAMLQAAVETLRRAQRFDFLPEFLLVRATLIHEGLRSNGEGRDAAMLRKLAAEDLEEAAEIIELGHMQLPAVDLALARFDAALDRQAHVEARRELERAAHLMRKMDYRLRAEAIAHRHAMLDSMVTS